MFPELLFNDLILSNLINYTLFNQVCIIEYSFVFILGVIQVTLKCAFL